MERKHAPLIRAHRILCALAPLALAACASSVEPSPAKAREERIASWEKLCEGRGFTRGTSDFKDCVLGYDKTAYDPPPLR